MGAKSVTCYKQIHAMKDHVIMRLQCSSMCHSLNSVFSGFRMISITFYQLFECEYYYYYLIIILCIFCFQRFNEFRIIRKLE